MIYSEIIYQVDAKITIENAAKRIMPYYRTIMYLFIIASGHIFAAMMAVRFRI